MSSSTETPAAAPAAIVPVRPFVPTVGGLESLWKRFDDARAAFSDELPKTPIEFCGWLANDSTRLFEVGDPADPVGLFIFAGIAEGEAAWAHLYIWNRHDPRYTHAGLIDAAQRTCAAIFQVFKLIRINGLTPVTHVHARVFAERVGFKVEGRLRHAVSVGGMRTDAWISGLLPSDLPGAAAAPREIMEKEEVAR